MQRRNSFWLPNNKYTSAPAHEVLPAEDDSNHLPLPREPLSHSPYGNNQRKCNWTDRPPAPRPLSKIIMESYDQRIGLYCPEAIRVLLHVILLTATVYLKPSGLRSIETEVGAMLLVQPRIL